jgi:hypothetical protein
MHHRVPDPFAHRSARAPAMAVIPSLKVLQCGTSGGRGGGAEGGGDGTLEGRAEAPHLRYGYSII